MSKVEKTPWQLTKDFLREKNAVMVNKVNDKGIALYNCLEYMEVENGIMLVRAVETDPPASFFLEFKRKDGEEGVIISATFKLETATLEQLKELLLREPYLAYNQEGKLHVSGIQQVQLANPTLAIYSFNPNSRKLTLDLKTGGLRSTVKYAFAGRF